MESKALGSLKTYMNLADQLVATASKEQLADCARILALNVAHYASRYGELPIEEHLDFLHVESLSDEQAKFVQQGMETFVGVLGNMLQQGYRGRSYLHRLTYACERNVARAANVHRSGIMR
jgi:hypothetical protein